MAKKLPSKFDIENPLDAVVALFGTSAEAARRIGVDRRHFSFWKGRGYIPSAWAARIEEVTGGKVKALDVVIYCGNRK